ncbi:MAG: hypothetical protein ACD_62C00247G0005 [uncultured bacterium]|nr:MAG: hypothetical protein ACD_62C00247G0005 [uncultured bacterium]
MLALVGLVCCPLLVNMSNQTTTPDPSLKKLLYTILITGMCILLLSLIVTRSLPFCLGVLLGLTLVTANFIFLIKIVVKILDRRYTRAGFVVLLLLFKLGFIACVLFLAFRVWHVGVLPFGLGYLSFMPAVLWHSLGPSLRA